MNTGQASPSAIIVLPLLADAGIDDAGLRRWLSRGQLARSSPSRDVLYRVLDETGHNVGGAGLAALRFWGQTGERSGAWMAAADPVHMRAGLNSLNVFSLSEEQLPSSDLRDLIEHLQETLGSSDVAFLRLGHCVYLRGNESIATAAVSPEIVHGLPPDELMPQGAGAKSHDRLLSEIQMALHAHDLNVNREQAGLPAINSLWIWGGGRAPAAVRQAIDPLYSNDPLFRGFWFSRQGHVRPWSADMSAQAQQAGHGFVSVVPEADADGRPTDVRSLLDALRTLLHSGRLKRLVVLFRSGLRAELAPAARFRFWRRESALLERQ